jgi:hypothetical protein
MARGLGTLLLALTLVSTAKVEQSIASPATLKAPGRAAPIGVKLNLRIARRGPRATSSEVASQIGIHGYRRKNPFLRADTSWRELPANGATATVGTNHLCAHGCFVKDEGGFRIDAEIPSLQLRVALVFKYPFLTDGIEPIWTAKIAHEGGGHEIELGQSFDFEVQPPDSEESFSVSAEFGPDGD